MDQKNLINLRKGAQKRLNPAQLQIAAKTDRT